MPYGNAKLKLNSISARYMEARTSIEAGCYLETDTIVLNKKDICGLRVYVSL